MQVKFSQENQFEKLGVEFWNSLTGKVFVNKQSWNFHFLRRRKNSSAAFFLIQWSFTLKIHLLGS